MFLNVKLLRYYTLKSNEKTFKCKNKDFYSCFLSGILTKEITTTEFTTIFTLIRS